MKLSDNLTIGARLLFLLRSQWWDEGRIAAYQEEKLVRIMRHAVGEIPFYAGLGLSLDSIRSAGDLERFPIITKKDIQDRKKEFLLRNNDPAAWFVSRTSGSTGEPTKTYFDRESWLLGKYALKIRRVLSTGLPFFKRLLIISEQPRRSLEKIESSMIMGTGVLFSQKTLSIFEDMDTHITFILDYRPDMIYAFPSYLLELCDELEKRGSNPIRIPVLFTSSEVLTPGSRQRIEKFFKGKIYDIYGSTEFKEVAFQCGRGAYHLNFENAFLEELPSDPGGDDGPGSLLITGLNNFAMPLIRFKLGDLGTVHGGRCECGRESPRLSDIGGREGDLIRLSGGRSVSPYLLTMKIEEYPAIRKYRIVQTGPSNLRVDFVAYPGEKLDGLCRSLPRDLRAVLGDSVEVDLKEVDEIVRSKSGKFRMVAKDY
jgi:phenylacetate-coenzyme A ligase PaaK-like adenylate-forming protein